VDNYDFGAYKAAGFGKFSDQSKEVIKQVKMKAPNIGLKGWWNYVRNFAKLSPVPSGMKFGEIPEGVLRLGGTYVIHDDEILYRWSDRLPGDHPDVKQVVEIARKGANKFEA